MRAKDDVIACVPSELPQPADAMLPLHIPLLCLGVTDSLPRPPIPYGAECKPALVGSNLDVAGHDLDQSSTTTTQEACNAFCCANPKCAGTLFEPQSGITWNNCTKGKPCCFLKTSVAGASPSPAPVPGGTFLFQMIGRSQDDEKLHFLSAALGDHAVLQRAPQQAVVWGFTAPNATVTTTMAPSDRSICDQAVSDGLLLSSRCHLQTFTVVAGTDGTWRQRLPATGASATPFHFTFASSNSSAERAAMADVLFGDVYLCGGQSNMEFSMPAVANASSERQLANKYPNIRFLSVGHRTSSPTPLRDLQTVWEPWQVASNETIDKDYSPTSHLFATFSAVCWLFGRQLSDALSPKGEVPIGLISSNWGGTKLEVWAPAETFAECNATAPPPYAHGGPMYNAMILPFAAGPMALSGFVWYQGEADTASAASAALYSCTFPSMIRAWRSAFRNPSLYFGFVQLSTWCALPPSSLPEMREAQMAALKLPNVGYATNADHGMGCNIHPAAKQYVSERLAASALAIRYGREALWKSPRYVSATPAAGSGDDQVQLKVRLADVSAQGLHLIRPFNYASPGYGPLARGDGVGGSPAEVQVNCSGSFPINQTANASMQEQCVWAALHVRGAGWLNATVALDADAQALILVARAPHGSSDNTILGSAYGWGPIPMMSAYDVGSGLPVLPWNTSLLVP